MITKSRAADTALAPQAAALLDPGGVPPPPDITASRRAATMLRLCEAYHCTVSAIYLVLVHSIT